MTCDALITPEQQGTKKNRPYAFQQQLNPFSPTSLQLEIFQFQQQLRKFLSTPLDLKLNENSSHFISIRFNNFMKPISASIHKLFLHAPLHIIETLALYIQKKGQDTALTQRLRDYIATVPITHRKDRFSQNTQTQGTYYNLTSFFEELNQRFFETPIDASIVWFQSPRRKQPIRNCSLGLYFDELKLIKINSALDSPSIPTYVISLIVYHEMLHAMYLPKILPSGKRVVHTKEFRKAEQRHTHFLEAEQWLDENRELFFQRLNNCTRNV